MKSKTSPGWNFPAFPLFVPASPAKRTRYREWGRSPHPAPILIGLPRASKDRSAPVCAIGVESTPYPRRDIPPELMNGGN
jgi:hypothetical protein